MYQPTEKFTEQLNTFGRRFKARLTVGDTVITDIKSLVQTSGSCGADTFTIGSVFASYIDATFANLDISLTGGEMQLEIGLVLPDGTDDPPVEYIPMGYYTVQGPSSISKERDQIKINAVDRITTKCSGVYVPAVTFPCSIKTVLDDIASQAGVTIKCDLDTSGTIETAMEMLTYRDVLGYIASLLGGFCYADRYGDIKLTTYPTVSGATIDKDRIQTLSTSDITYDVEMLTVVVSESGTDADGNEVDGVSYSEGNGSGLSVSNPYMTQSLFDAMKGRVVGYSFASGTLAFLGNPCLDPKDAVTAVNYADQEFFFPCTNIVQDFDGGLTTTITTPGTATSDDSVKGPTQKALEQLQTEMILAKEVIAKKITAEDADLKYATIEKALILEAEIDKLTGIEAEFEIVKAGQLEVTEKLNAQVADIESLHAKDAALESALIGKAEITDLEVVQTKTTLLESDLGTIKTLVNGNLTSDNIQSIVITSDKFTVQNGFIKNAMIESLAFDKITGVDINTTKLTVHSEDGKSTWSDNTIQISDTNRVRVQIGKDASGDYTLAVWDASGKLIWDALGATENTIQRKIIRDAVVADDAAISGSKLDIESVVKEVNGAQTKLSSATILVDEDNQTLDVYLNTLETTVGDNLDAAKLYADGQLSAAQQYALTAANNALSSAKSYTDAVEIGGRNLYTGSADFAGEWKNLTQYADYETNDSYGNAVKYKSGAWGGIYQLISAKKGDTFTLSASVRGDGSTCAYCYATEYADNGSTIHGTAVKNMGVLSTDESRINATYTVLNDCNLSLRFENTTSGHPFYISSLKLERGSKDTDWTPAPEDTTVEIASVKEITTTNSTNISVMQGQISSLITEDTTIKGDYDALVSRYNATVADVSSIKTTISEHTTLLSSQTQDILAVQTKANTLESTLDGFKVTVSETYVTKADFNDLEIGGRNLYKRTGDFDKSYWDSYASLETYENNSAYKQAVCTDGDNYLLSTKTSDQGFDFSDKTKTWTLSAMIKGSAANQTVAITLDTNRQKVYPQTLEKDIWKKIVWTFTGSAALILFRFTGTNASASYPIRIAQVKVEEGNKATGWTPAPEDMATASDIASANSRIATAETKIDQNSSSITLLASRTTIVEDKFSDYYTKEQTTSAINQKADSITLSVSSTYATKEALEVTDVKASNAMPKSGGTLTGPLTVTGGDSATAGKIILDSNGNGQITDSNTATLIGFNSNDTLTMGHAGYKTNVRGKSSRPTYNGSDMAMGSDVTAVATRVTTCETAIDQNTEAIELRATKTEVTTITTAVATAQSTADTAQSIANSVKSDLSSNYYTKSDTEAKIQVSAESITQAVSETYQTKDAMSSYSTTAQVNSAIEQKASSITSTVASTYATKTALAAKVDDYTIDLYNGTGGNPKGVKCVTVNYSNCTSETGILIKIGMVSGHGNGVSYTFLQDVIIRVDLNGTVEVDNSKHYGAETPIYDGEVRQYGDIFWVIDTANKVVDFYCLMGQYSHMYQTPLKRLNQSTGGIITQHTGCTVYSSGNKAWANNSDIATMDEVDVLAERITSAELKLTADGITSIVGDYYATSDDLAAKIALTETKIEQTAASLTVSINDAAKTATNFLKYDGGLIVGEIPQTDDETLGNNVLITTNDVRIRNGETVLAKYAGNQIDLGCSGDISTINLLNNSGTIEAVQIEDFDALRISTGWLLDLQAKCRVVVETTGDGATQGLFEDNGTSQIASIWAKTSESDKEAMCECYTNPLMAKLGISHVGVGDAYIRCRSTSMVTNVNIVAEDNDGTSSSIAMTSADVTIWTDKLDLQCSVDVGNNMNVTGALNVGGSVASSGTFISNAYGSGLINKTSYGQTGIVTLSSGDALYIYSMKSGSSSWDSSVRLADSNGVNLVPKSGGKFTGVIEMANTLVVPGAKTSNDTWTISNATKSVKLGTQSWSPVTDKTVYLGHGSYRWTSVYAGSSTISTSDRNEKKDFRTFDCNENYEKLFLDLKPTIYKFKDGTSDRDHFGFISQDIEESLYSLGFNDLSFAGFCKDVKMKNIAEGAGEEDLVPALDENGNEQYTYSLRYEEFIALNTYMIQKLWEKVKKLESCN